MTITQRVYIDFDNDGSYSTAGDEITAYVKRVRVNIGTRDQMQLVAQVGTCSITLHNQTRYFSPANSGSPYYNKLIPGRWVKVEAVDSANGQSWTIFIGVVRTIKPQHRTLGTLECVIECQDRIGLIQAAKIDLPLQQSVTSDALIRRVLNEALRANPAAASVIIVGNITAGNFVNVNGTVYTFRASLTAANDVLIGSSIAENVANLAAAINGAEGSGTIYHASTTRPNGVIAVESFPAVQLKAILRGAIGNSYTVAKSGTNILLSGSTLLGGADASDLLLSAGDETFDIAADSWSGERTNGLTAIKEVVESERGRFFQRQDGMLVFESRSDQFRVVSETAALALNGEMIGMDGAVEDADIINSVRVQVQPRITETAGAVVAKASGTVLVPGRQGGDRFDPNAVISPSSGLNVITLPFRDSAGNNIGAKDLILPLVPGTDWTANEQADGSGVEYTFYTPQQLFFSVVTKGSGVEISIRNSALGPLYLRKLEVRGTGLTKYNPQTFISEDATSITTHGKRTMAITLPLASDAQLAESLSSYLLNRYKDPQFRISSIVFNSVDVVSATNLFGLIIGDLITISEDQVAVSAQKYRIIGAEYDMGALNAFSVRWHVERLDDVTYWILGDPVYGVLGSTTRLAV
jgi:hypothetical protein